MKKIISFLVLGTFAMGALTGCSCFRTKPSYVVNFISSMDNSIFHSNNVTEGYYFRYPDPPSYEGYRFDSWSMDSQRVYSNLDVIAYYVPNVYKVTLDYNHEGVENKSINVTYNSDYAFEDAVWEGHSFKGWKDNDGQTWMSGIYKLTSDLYLTASWELNSYSINYHLDGGTNNPLNPTTVTYDDSVDLQTATKEGYDFVGWYSDSSFSTKIEKLDKTASNIDLYAKFSPREFDIKFYVGNEVVYSRKTEYGEKILFQSDYNYNPRGDFKGWYIDDELIDLDSYVVQGNTDLHAKYYENYIYLAKQQMNNEWIITVGALKESIIGAEFFVTFAEGSQLSLEESNANIVYNIDQNSLYLNVMYEDNIEGNFDIFKLKVSTESSAENIIVSIETKFYQKVDGTIQKVNKDFLVF